MIDFSNKLTISKPDLPDLDEYVELLRDIWGRRYITNFGNYHQQLETGLRTHLGCKNLSLFCNGTVALQVGLQALELSGEVITTPFTFPATTHAIHWNHCEPVFCDIDPQSFCLDPAKLEACITPATSAILPVHVYGHPCDVEAIQAIADAHGLKVLYDAAHAFDVKFQDGRSILEFGDISMLSFHATKVFNTVEGGALVTGDSGLKERIDSLRNFGIVDEVTVLGPGTNGKMNELSAAYGLLVLKFIEKAIALRGAVDSRYRENLKGIGGLKIPPLPAGTVHNFSYVPIIVEPSFGMSRDEIFARLVKQNILARPYFYPLTSNVGSYTRLQSAAEANLPVANAVARSVLCLPIYSTLTMSDVDRICSILADLRLAT